MPDYPDIPPAPRLPRVYEGEPSATIERVGRWRYWVTVTWGLMALGEFGGWHKWGRKRAEASARRAMTRWKAEAARETWTITP